MPTEDKELDILQSISLREGSIRQRDLAQIIGLSLGMTNVIVRRLVQKGWLKIRKVNNRNMQYIVSPDGMEAIAKRSYRYFRRTVRNVVFYKEAIDRLLAGVAKRGIGKVVLVGGSDLDFIVEHLCRKNRLAFAKLAEGAERDLDPREAFVLYSERSRAKAGGDGSASLRHIFDNRLVHPAKTEQDRPSQNQ